MSQKTCKTRSQLASDYGIDRKTLVRKLKYYNIQLPPGILTPDLVDKVYSVLGKPSS